MSLKFILSGDIVKARAECGWTQAHVADLLSISVRGYQKIESGEVVPHTITFIKLVELFGLDVHRYAKELGFTPSETSDQ